MLGPQASELIQLLVSDKLLEPFSDLVLVQGTYHLWKRRIRALCFNVMTQTRDKACEVLEHQVLHCVSNKHYPDLVNGKRTLLSCQSVWSVLA